MSGQELKPCPFCGDIPAPISRGIAGQPRWQHPDNDHCPISGYLLGGETFTAAWNRRTPDPAQIRADAIREAAALIHRIADGYADGGDNAIACGLYLTEGNVIALLDTPLSPTAVDGSPAPDAGGKEPCNECFLPANETCDICGAVGPSGKAGGKGGVA